MEREIVYKENSRKSIISSTIQGGDTLYGHIQTYENQCFKEVFNMIVLSGDHHNFPQNMLVLDTSSEQVLELSKKDVGLRKVLLKADVDGNMSHILFIINEETFKFDSFLEVLINCLRQRLKSETVNLVLNDVGTTEVTAKMSKTNQVCPDDIGGNCRHHYHTLRDQVCGIISNCL